MKPSGSYRPVYQRKRWNILFIGENGTVVPVKYFKGIVTVLALLFVGLAVAVVVLTFLNRHQTDRVRALRHDLAGQLDENRTLKAEKDQMLARVVILESELKARRDGDPSASPEIMDARLRQQEQAAHEAGAVKKEDNGSADPEKGLDSKNPAAPDDGGQNAPGPVAISTENLLVCQDPNSDFMRVEFKVMNLGPKGVPFSGRAVIILKKEDMDPTEWIVLPNVPLVDRKPEGQRGRLFRIYNFRTLKFKIKSPDLSEPLKYASIYTYTEDGEMLMERDMPLEITDICP